MKEIIISPGSTDYNAAATAILSAVEQQRETAIDDSRPLVRKQKVSIRIETDTTLSDKTLIGIKCTYSATLFHENDSLEVPGNDSFEDESISDLKPDSPYVFPDIENEIF